MTYTITWGEAAITAAAQFLEGDREGLRQLMDAVELLADHPRGPAEYGSPNIHRMHIGRYRVLYEIDEATVTILIIHVGRLG